MKQIPCLYVHLLLLSASISFLPTEATVSSIIPIPNNSSHSVNKSHPLKIQNTTADYLDSIIQKYALKVLNRRTKTGIVYKVPLPTNLSGIQASILRVRSRTIWLNGLTIGPFHIPPRTISVPPVRRLIIIFQNLGNWSDSYYKVQNYTLATPVLGLLTYDANYTIRTIELSMPVVVSFSRVFNTSENAKCMTFGKKGSQRLDGVIGSDSCLSASSGHFSIVVPERVEPVPGERKAESRRRRRRWVVWAVVVGVGVAGALVLLCVVGVGIAKCVKGRKMENMTKRADEDEVLDVVWVNGRKMPSASMIRTQPVLENGFAP